LSLRSPCKCCVHLASSVSRTLHGAELEHRHRMHASSYLCSMVSVTLSYNASINWCRKVLLFSNNALVRLHLFCYPQASAATHLLAHNFLTRC